MSNSDYYFKPKFPPAPALIQVDRGSITVDGMETLLNFFKAMDNYKNSVLKEAIDYAEKQEYLKGEDNE